MEAIEKIQKAVPDTETRVCRRIGIGHAIHQGDVYMHRVLANHPRGKPLGTRQVAVGTTVGSRHVVEGADVAVFAGKAFQPSQKRKEESLLGPVVVATDTFTLTHPEHAHHVLPAGTYQVTYQWDDTTMGRVAD